MFLLHLGLLIDKAVIYLAARSLALLEDPADNCALCVSGDNPRVARTRRLARTTWRILGRIPHQCLRLRAILRASQLPEMCTANSTPIRAIALQSAVRSDALGESAALDVATSPIGGPFHTPTRGKC